MSRWQLAAFILLAALAFLITPANQDAWSRLPWPAAAPGINPIE